MSLRFYIYPELRRCFKCVEVRAGGNAIFKSLQKYLLKIQHLWQTAKQRLHLHVGRRIKYGAHELFVLDGNTIQVKAINQYVATANKETLSINEFVS